MDVSRTLEPRILTPSEANTLIAALAGRMAVTQEGMATAADGREMARLKQLIIEFDRCEALHKLVRMGNLRVHELKP